MIFEIPEQYPCELLQNLFEKYILNGIKRAYLNQPRSNWLQKKFKVLIELPPFNKS